MNLSTDVHCMNYTFVRCWSTRSNFFIHVDKDKRIQLFLPLVFECCLWNQYKYKQVRYSNFTMKYLKIVSEWPPYFCITLSTIVVAVDLDFGSWRIIYPANNEIPTQSLPAPLIILSCVWSNRKSDLYRINTSKHLLRGS